MLENGDVIESPLKELEKKKQCSMSSYDIKNKKFVQLLHLKKQHTLDFIWDRQIAKPFLLFLIWISQKIKPISLKDFLLYLLRNKLSKHILKQSHTLTYDWVISINCLNQLSVATTMLSSTLELKCPANTFENETYWHKYKGVRKSPALRNRNAQ